MLGGLQLDGLALHAPTEKYWRWEDLLILTDSNRLPDLYLDFQEGFLFADCIRL